jgi:hypothetical protein
MNTSGACRLNKNILFSFLVGSFNLAGRSDSFLRGAYWLMINQPANTRYNPKIANPAISISYLLLSNNLNLTHLPDNFCQIGRVVG